MIKKDFVFLSKKIFNQAINDYHISDNVDTQIINPFSRPEIEAFLYEKCWIDTVQWHLEDIIRNPEIDPIEALKIKRRIDFSNQERTDLVELIDSYFFEQFSAVSANENARINTESPAWAIDRLSILQLKIFHMQAETLRADATDAHREACQKKLAVLQEQNRDLSTAIEQLLDELASGEKRMKTYKQMKMYNDPNLNPVLYDKK